MLERLKGRTGVICFCFVIWAALTLAHFMDVEFFSGITSKFQMSHFLKASQTLKRRPGPGADQVGEKTSSDEEEEKKEEKKEEEEEKVKDQEVDDLVAEAGQYDAWWREQIGRRVRVAETCVRCESSHFLLLLHMLHVNFANIGNPASNREPPSCFFARCPIFLQQVNIIQMLVPCILNPHCPSPSDPLFGQNSSLPPLYYFFFDITLFNSERTSYGLNLLSERG